MSLRINSTVEKLPVSMKADRGEISVILYVQNIQEVAARGPKCRQTKMTLIKT